MVGATAAGANFIYAPLWHVLGGPQGRRETQRAGDCISQGRAREMGTTWDISQRGHLMQGLGYKGAGRKDGLEQKEKVGWL